MKSLIKICFIFNSKTFIRKEKKEKTKKLMIINRKSKNDDESKTNSVVLGIKYFLFLTLSKILCASYIAKTIKNQDLMCL